MLRIVTDRLGSYNALVIAYYVQWKVKIIVTGTMPWKPNLGNQFVLAML